MEHGQTALRRIVLLDDTTGCTVTSNGQTLPAKAGEGYAFQRLAEGLTRVTGVAASVGDTLPQVLEPGTVCIVPTYQLERWQTELAARNARPAMIVVDAAREKIAQLMESGSVAGAVEHHQYWAWKTNERADASLFGDLRLVPSLQREVTVTPLGAGRFGRLRIEGEDLPGLLGDYLLAFISRA